MGTSTAVPALQAEWKNLRNGNAVSSYDSTIEGGTGGVQYISRLECMQIAVKKQLEHLNAMYPHKRVVLIAFSSDVSWNNNEHVFLPFF